jgi:hypothetical protein
MVQPQETPVLQSWPLRAIQALVAGGIYRAEQQAD